MLVITGMCVVYVAFFGVRVTGPPAVCLASPQGGVGGGRGGGGGGRGGGGGGGGGGGERGGGGGGGGGREGKEGVSLAV